MSGFETKDGVGGGLRAGRGVGDVDLLFLLSDVGLYTLQHQANCSTSPRLVVRAGEQPRDRGHQVGEPLGLDDSGVGETVAAFEKVAAIDEVEV